MKLFDASFDTVLYRYYFLMAVVIIPFLIGVPWLAFLALPVFLSAFMGVNFKPWFNRYKKTGSRLELRRADPMTKAA